ncbi:MAG: type II toxin-antitoxin system RelE/ParE family toxin [Eubacteriales bacterium]
MYRLVYTNKAARQIKKMDKQVKIELKKRLELIAIDPYLGRKKKGKLQDIWGYGFNWQGIAYRIAYKIFNDELVILVFAAGSHEGFWEQISR